MSAKLIPVIEVGTTRGKGVIGDLVRVVTQYWSPDGCLLAESDPCAPVKEDPRIMRVIRVLMANKPCQATADEALAILHGPAA